MVREESGVGLQLRVRQHLSQKQVRSELRVDEDGVLADPAQARPLRVIALQDRSVIDVRLRARSHAADATDVLGERGELLLEDMMVVLTTRVARDERPGRVGYRAAPALVVV